MLDPFMGAGTVGVVAERLGRRWLGIELNEEFVTLAEARIADARRERSVVDEAAEAIETEVVGEQRNEHKTKGGEPEGGVR